MDADIDGVLDNTSIGIQVEELEKKLNPIYLADNGVTIKARDWAFVGDAGMLNGIEYLIVSREQLRSRIINGEGVTNVCTSRLVYLSGMLRGAISFNQDISHWDTSNVIDMGRMFSGALSFNQDLSEWEVSKVQACAEFSDNTPKWILPKPSFILCTP